MRLELKIKDIYCLLEINQSHRLKPYIEFNTEIRIEAEKIGYKDGKAMYKLMENAVYGKTMGKLENKIYVKFVSNQKDYFKWTLKPNYLLHKIFDND